MSNAYPTRPTTAIRPINQKNSVNDINNNAKHYKSSPLAPSTSSTSSTPTLKHTNYTSQHFLSKSTTPTTGSRKFKINTIQELKQSFFDPNNTNVADSTKPAPNLSTFNGNIEWCLEKDLPNWQLNKCFVDEYGRLIIYDESQTISNTKIVTSTGNNAPDIISNATEFPKEILVDHIQDYHLTLEKYNVNECPVIQLTSHINTTLSSSDKLTSQNTLKDKIFFRFGNDRHNFKKFFMTLIYWGNKKCCGMLEKFEIVDSKLANSTSSLSGQDLPMESVCECAISYSKSEQSKLDQTNHKPWKNSSLSLSETTGELCIDVYEEANTGLQSSQQKINLTKFLMSEIFILDPSLCESIDEHILVIKHLPQLRKLYNVAPLTSSEFPSCVYLRFKMQVDVEMWYASLIPFTQFEVLKMYGSDDSNDLRLSNSLKIVILEADLKKLAGLPTTNFFVEIVIWDELFAQTSKVTSTSSVPFWRDEFHFKFHNNINKIVLKIKQTNGLELGHVSIDNDLLFNRGFSCEEIRLPVKSFKKNPSLAGTLMLKIENQWNFVLPSANFDRLDSILQTIDLNQLIKILYSEKLNQDQKIRASSVALDVLTNLKRENEYVQLLVEKEIDEVIQLLLSKTTNNTPTSDTSSSQHIYNCLFRGNSNLTKVMEYYFHTVGQEYLLAILKPIVNDIITSNADCEIDPSRIRTKTPPPVLDLDGANIHQNAAVESCNSVDEIVEKHFKTLLGYAEEIWASIYQTSKDMPQAIKDQLKTLRNNLELFSVQGLTKEEVDNLIINCISSFLFLRFFCPVLLNPKIFNIISDHPSETNKRTLTLLSKLLLNLSTLTPFGLKEPYMHKFNAFIEQHKPEMLDYNDKITGKKIDFNSKTMSLSWMKNIKLQSKTVFCSLSVPFLIDKCLKETEFVELLSNFYFGNNAQNHIEESTILFKSEAGSLKLSAKDDFDFRDGVASTFTNRRDNRTNLRASQTSGISDQFFEIGELEFENLSDNNTRVFGQDMLELLKLETDHKDLRNIGGVHGIEEEEEILHELETECKVLCAKRNRLIQKFSNYECITKDYDNFISYVVGNLYLESGSGIIRALKPYEDSTEYKKLFHSLPSMEKIFGVYALYGTMSMDLSNNQPLSRYSKSNKIPTKTSTNGNQHSSASPSPTGTTSKISRSFSRLFRRRD
ncbi:hypothetical protein ACO0QE_002019 [Hanseniaspora vineae]